MSYMGIKQHCITLQRDGYLDTWRRPQRMGRPEMVYRLTRRSHDLFQADSNQFTLDLLKSSRGNLRTKRAGETALQHFQKEDRGSESKGEGRHGCGAREMARARPRRRRPHGAVHQQRNDGGPHILECHSPILNLVERYPIIGRFEQDMFETVSGLARAPRSRFATRVCTSARFISRCEQRVFRFILCGVVFRQTRADTAAVADIAARCPSVHVGFASFAPRESRLIDRSWLEPFHPSSSRTCSR